MENAGTGRRILIVGTGFVGSTVLRYLASQSIEADSLSRYEQYDGSHYDYVVYARGRNKGHDNYSEDVNNAVGFMYDAMRSGVGKVLLISSGAYKSMTNPYDAAKYEVEMIASRILGKRLCIARCFSFVGPHVPKHFGIMQMIYGGLNAGVVTVVQPDAVRSYMYEDDLGRYLATILFHKDTGGQVCDVGSVYPYTMCQIGQRIADYCGAICVGKKTTKPTTYVPAENNFGLSICYPLSVAITLTLKCLTQPAHPFTLSTVT